MEFTVIDRQVLLSEAAIALHTYAQMRRDPQASAVSLRARDAYRQFAAEFGEASTDVMLCGIQISRGDYREAKTYCEVTDRADLPQKLSSNSPKRRSGLVEIDL